MDFKLLLDDDSVNYYPHASHRAGLAVCTRLKLPVGNVFNMLQIIGFFGLLSTVSTFALLTYFLVRDVYPDLPPLTLAWYSVLLPRQPAPPKMVKVS